MALTRIRFLLSFLLLLAAGGSLYGQTPGSTWYLTAGAGIASNRSIDVTATPSTNYSNLPLRGMYLKAGAGMWLSERWTGELSFSRSRLGTSLSVPGLVTDVPDYVLTTSSFYQLWTARLTAGYRLQYKRFSFTPRLGAGLAMRLHESMFAADILVNGIHSVTLRMGTAMTAKHPVALVAELPLEITLPVKGEDRLLLSWNAGFMVFAKYLNRTEVALQSPDKGYVAIVTRNRGLTWSHSLSLSWIFNHDN